jgi:MSHA biogenesis protein MshE
MQEQAKTGARFGRVLIDKGFIDEATFLRSLANELKAPYIDLSEYPVNPTIAQSIPEIHARRYRVVALAQEEDSVVVGMADPTNIFAFDELSRLLRKHLIVSVVSESDVLKVLDRVYQQQDEITGFAEELQEQLTENDSFLNDKGDSVDNTETPVAKLLQSMFEDAIRSRASDIHIEPDEKVLRIRQRIDGVLREHVINEKRVTSALIVRLKLMAGLDISEKRLPQDGRFSMMIGTRQVDIRLSTMPIYHGEAAVMRLLDQSEGIPDLAQLGMRHDIRERYETIVARPHGMVLVTGPTGSGKTTTLYSTLKLLNKPKSKIITVEDPVEYRLPRINQVQVNPEINLDFARVLRTILRQDPDVVLIGEMRDAETVQIGLRAAMTGHLVFSTLHTNDAVSTATRLLDMGSPGYLLASSLKAIIAQRLIRRLCPKCRVPEEPNTSETVWLRRVGGTHSEYYTGEGCQDCNHTGYKGRIAVHELLVIDHELSLALASGDSAAFIRQALLSPEYRTLDRVALEHAQKGLTSLEEVMRVVADLYEGEEADDKESTVVAKCNPYLVDDEQIDPLEQTQPINMYDLQSAAVDGRGTEETRSHFLDDIENLPDDIAELNLDLVED